MNKHLHISGKALTGTALVTYLLLSACSTSLGPNSDQTLVNSPHETVSSPQVSQPKAPVTGSLDQPVPSSGPNPPIDDSRAESRQLDKTGELNSPSPANTKFTNSLGMSFVSLPAGSFTMGIDQAESKFYGGQIAYPKHQVTLSSFQIQTTEVTQKQWKEVMGKEHPKPIDENSLGHGDNYPVRGVSWCDIVGEQFGPDKTVSCKGYKDSFLKRLNERGEGTYRLLTEAEWEYAARAGSTKAYACGDFTEYKYPDGAQKCPFTMGFFKEEGLYTENTIPTFTAPVASKEPNIWGIYDMHGNVEEWVQDWAGTYSAEPQTNPLGPSQGKYRIIRGGNARSNAYYAHSGHRKAEQPFYADKFRGFRLVHKP